MNTKNSSSATNTNTSFNKDRPKRFFIGISLKLFFAFWLAILTSALISYIVIQTFRHSPIQEEANPQQLEILNNLARKIEGKHTVKFQQLQKRFHKQHNQDLLIKKIGTAKLYSPRDHGWSNVRGYLKKHSLENPVTIDFGFTKVTSSPPFFVNNSKYQLFSAEKLPRKSIVSLLVQLPMAIRILMLLLISFLLCWLLAKSFTSPLIAIQKASKDIGEGKLTTRITKFDQRADEFGALAHSFNQMAEQLENNISSHQRLLGDVSHELRSPLTRLQLAVALAEKNIGNTAEQQKHLSRCEMEVERLDEMIADVLTLSRLEHSQKAFACDDTNLNHLVSQVVTDCQYFASSKDVSIEFKESGKYTLLADDKLLASAISNVLNNAVKYSANNQVVTVELTQQHEQIMLSVFDNGPGVPDEMLDKLFKPFFRVADARDRSSGGTGLGLAIAQQAILMHHGEIIAENIKPSGLKITIVLPMAKMG
ncbi:ATP-binding protein [Colwellia echini]|uniref:histidine kinase n=1 Tax=Colwellia echini TaxID=1982103 RepID=A0ABY3MTJ4_9GAMM|nr:ATP-binding protein [Colwellia echini]TYK64528.1 HAMP domain-containing protein [Colwellia echini]